jgi:hypothetical protein
MPGPPIDVCEYRSFIPTETDQSIVLWQACLLQAILPLQYL